MDASQGRRMAVGAVAASVVLALTVPGAAVAGGSGGVEATAAGTWVARENAKAGTTAWRIPKDAVATDRQMSAYASHSSITAGNTFRLFASTVSSSFTVRAFRVGHYQGKGARLIWQSGRVLGKVQAAPTVVRSTRMVRTRWEPSLRVNTTGWPEGSYLLKLTTAAGRQRYVPLTVRSRNTAGDLVIMNAITTYQAYNAWGGYSLYHGRDGRRETRSYKVSYDRPYDGDGAKTFGYMERGPIIRAERLGLSLAYITNIDLHRNPRILDGAAGLVSLGHDEYWTRSMKHTVERVRNRGTNIAFLGANALYWRVRLEKSRLGPARKLVGYKDARRDPLYGLDNKNVTVRFRDYPAPSPENSLVGMLYECYPAYGALVIHDPNFFLYRGTNVSKGTRFRGLASIEVDRARRTATTPDRLRIVAHSPVSCPNGRTYADSTYYTVAGGGGVFSTGTMVWSRTLRGPYERFDIGNREVAFVRQVTDNLFRAMATGPLDRTHRSRGNWSSAY
jgi:hypothetical protein